MPVEYVRLNGHADDYGDPCRWSEIEVAYDKDRDEYPCLDMCVESEIEGAK